MKSNKSEEKVIVEYKNEFFDLTNFLSKHPGGINTLANLDGKNIDKKFKCYKHSFVAENLMKDYKIDENNNFDESLENLIDWNSGILKQLYKLGDRYDEWVHLPVDRVVKFFDNSLLEMMTKTPWYAILIFWIPVLLFVITTEIMNGINLKNLLFNLLIGFCLWTLIEYILHRYLFHMKPGKRMAFKIIHFLFHGVHHKTPFDEMRIVFPPIPALILTITIHNLLKPFFYANCFNRTIITCGGVIGYLIYDLTHCYIHHGSPKNEYFYQLKRYHYNHHFVNQNIGFGVSSPFWDKIFNTEISLKKLSFRLKW